MLETIRKMIFQDIIITINKYFISLSIFLIFTIIIVYISEKLGIKRFFFEVKEKFLREYSYKWKILFFTYFYFILEKTLFDRSFGVVNNVKSSIKENWLFLEKDVWSKVQAIENILFFVPFSFFLILAFFDRKNIGFKLLKTVVKFSFFLSLFIELTQLVLTLGTFQFSDIVYNTLGGIIGYILVILVDCIDNLKNKLKKLFIKN